VIICPHCGYENPEEETLCIRCSMPLSLHASTDGMTRRLEDDEEIVAQARWGTAQLGLERKLLLHVRGHDRPLVVTLSKQLVLGRHDVATGGDPDVDLEEYDALNHGVSRRHVAILVEDEALKIMDLGSANFTYLNGQKLMPHQARILRDGDELRLGKLVIRVNFA
jgi:hypothetical protein